MKEEKVYLQLDYQTQKELNTLSNSLRSMAYEKKLEFKYFMLEKMYATGVFDKEKYESELVKLWDELS